MFEEPGRLETVAQLASKWFVRYFTAADDSESGAFQDRRDAGRQLAKALRQYAGQSDLLVLALPRGGVPVAYEVAQALHAPLDVVVVRKLGLPGQEELAMGAIASGGVRVVNDDVVHSLDLQPETIEGAAEREGPELRRREQTYRGDRPPLAVAGRTVILVDDGLATGSTMRAAVAAVRQLEPRRIVVAVPVGPCDVCETMREEADDVVCLRTPEQFMAVGRWYTNFGQTTDEEVRDLLASAPSSAPRWVRVETIRAGTECTAEAEMKITAEGCQVSPVFLLWLSSCLKNVGLSLKIHRAACWRTK